MTKISLNLPDTLICAIKDLSQVEGVSQASIIRKSIRIFLELKNNDGDLNKIKLMV